MTQTITAAQIIANELQIHGGGICVMKPSPEQSDSIVTGVNAVVLWSDERTAIMRLEVANDQPLTVKQLIRAVQCGYIVSAERSTRFGPRRGQVPAHVAAGCRISTDNMPHAVEYSPIRDIYVSDMMYIDGYQAAVNDNGRLDILLQVGS